MIPEYSEDELRMWLEAQNYEIGRFGPLLMLCEKLTGDLPQIVEFYLREKNDIKLGEWIYFYDFGKIVRISNNLKEKQHDPDKDVLIVRTKSSGSTIKITRRDLKMASGESETLLKPEYPIFEGR
ncbi:MAG: hypothetical protein KGI28_01570 [Thaumarchaeota archaeon]|nr:hypothetical protein [Nitrososphaerota archaeon]